MQGLFSRLLCACMDAANKGRDFAGTITGGEWLIGELSGCITWDNPPCFKGLSEKSHGDYFGVLDRFLREQLAMYDLRKCGRILEMKNRFCGDDGLFNDFMIRILKSNHKSFTTIIDRFLAHGGGLTLAVRVFWGNGTVRDWCGE